VLEPWPGQGIPGSPRAGLLPRRGTRRWIGYTAANFEKKQEAADSGQVQEQLAMVPEDEAEDAILGDDRLLLMFTARWSPTRLSGAFLPSTKLELSRKRRSPPKSLSANHRYNRI